LTLEEHYQKQLRLLKKDQEIYRYIDSHKVYRLIYDGAFLKLFSKEENRVRKLNWDSVNEEIARFHTIDEFWSMLTQEDHWFKIYSPINFEHGSDKLIAKSIIQFHNNFIQQDFDLADFQTLHKWMNSVYTDSIKSTEYKQYCSNCKKAVSPNARYPKYICEDCVELLTDTSGRKVKFFNTELIGHGCQGYYEGAGSKEKYHLTTAFIEEKEFFAKEAYFGGIVIQLKE